MRADLAPGGDIAALVRAAEGGAVTIVIPVTFDPLAMALARAAIAPLAMERAPGMRVNAVCPGADAAEADVTAAVAFLEGAGSTTGQVLEVK